MTSAQFIHLLHHQDSSLELNELLDKFPCSSILQLVNYKAKKQGNKLSLEKVALYKNNPYLFASYIKGTTHEEIATIESAETTKLESIPLEKDILTEINELEDVKIITIASPSDLNTEDEAKEQEINTDAQEQSLMQMMSFKDWLNHFSEKKKAEQLEIESKNKLTAHIQKEKLASVLDEDADVIPEKIFNQAMNSISDNEIVSESLAEILIKQGKYLKAIEMYKKLSLRNSEKSAYFAKKIKEVELKNE
jgi:hypothetical protein